jgi:hypothetical protein
MCTAIPAADAAVRSSPALAKGHSRRGAALLGLGRCAEAAAAFEEALRLSGCADESDGRDDNGGSGSGAPPSYAAAAEGLVEARRAILAAAQRQPPIVASSAANTPHAAVATQDIMFGSSGGSSLDQPD